MKDNDIIRGIRENSETAWRELFKATHDKFAPMISPILKWKSETAYDDVYEQACLDLMENVKEGRLKEGDRANVSGYLYILCKRKAIRANDLRKKEVGRNQKYGNEEAAERAVEEASDKNLPLEVKDPEAEQKADQESWEKAMALLDKVLASIPERCRAILRRYYWDKMPMKDIAAAMGLKNDDVAKATKNKCMRKFESVAKEMVADDKELEAAVRRAVERDALRDLLEELRQEASGELAAAACVNKEDEEDDKK